MAFEYSPCARHISGLNSMGDKDLDTPASSHSPLMEKLPVKGQVIQHGGIKRAVLPSAGKSQSEQSVWIILK